MNEEKESDRLLDIGAKAYRNGNYQKAQKYYEKAAKMGNAQAACNLGYIFEFGRTGKRNYEKAFHWFKQAADCNNANACYKMGDLYYFGDYVKQDNDQAFAYYQKAADIAEQSNQDDDLKSDIYYRIALCGHKGIGVEQNDLVALRYINEAEFYSYCDRFAGKFRWQSTAKRIEQLRAAILENLDNKFGK